MKTYRLTCAGTAARPHPRRGRRPAPPTTTASAAAMVRFHADRTERFRRRALAAEAELTRRDHTRTTGRTTR